MSAIRISHVSKSFKSRSGPVPAVRDLDMEVAEGEVLGFLGPNGAGKTTTIKMICGLTIPDEGSIHIQGLDVQRRRRRAMSHIGAVLEGTRNIYWRLTPLQNLKYSARLKGVAGYSSKAWGETLLQELELWHRRHDPVREFSRGMQQKTAIACALIHDPPILLLDEPTLGLDIRAGVTVRNWIRTLSQRYGKTLILTTHQLDVAEELCQRIAVIRKGSKVADHTVQELRDMHRREAVEARLATLDPDAIRVLLEQKWPEASMQFATDSVTLTIPAGRDLNLAETAAALEEWPCEILSLTRTEPSLEDIFMILTEEEPADA